jgi:tetratricopeptide (TPR) repeat protein
MKKYLIGLTLLIILIFSGCIISNNFSSYHQLALNAIANGSKESARNYSSVLINSSENNEQKSIALMTSGYANFLFGEYEKALLNFTESIELVENEAALAGMILSYFMLNQYDIMNFHLDSLQTISNNWVMIVNLEELTKAKLFEIYALTNAIMGDREHFNLIKTNVTPKIIEKMEGFFFE